MAIEYRVCWNAGSNISFHGETDWEPANEGETADEVQDSMGDVTGGIRLPQGLEMALEGSGFDWWVETREMF